MSEAAPGDAISVDTHVKMRKLFPILAAVVLAVLLLVTAFVADTVRKNRLRYVTNAEETSRDLALTLEHFLHSHFQEVDLTLRRAALDFREMHAEGRFSDAAFSAYLRTLKERIPQARSIRGSDRDGRVIYGEEIDPAHVQNLTTREFFQRARTERELIFGIPVKSRITGEWVFPLMYGMTLPDGDFGGTAYVNMNNSRVTDLFASLNLGQHGVVTLIDSRRLLLIRYPEGKNIPIGSPVTLSPEGAAVFAAGSRHATYTATSASDGQRRVSSLEQIGDYPVFVLVGLSDQDFLAPWRGETRDAGIFLVVLYLLAAMALWSVRRSLRTQYQFMAQLVEKDTALLNSLSALTASEARMRSLTEGLPQMVWTTTAELRLDFLSHHWHDYTGIPEARLLAAGDWSEAAHPDEREPLGAEWRGALAGREQFRCACRLRRRDGVWRVFDHHALPQKDARGAILCWVGSSTDITEVRESHEALLTAKEQALSAGRAKSEFLANMSHEIRSPMNAVLGMLQLLRLTQLNLRQLDYASKAESAARALLGILNDILDFSKVEAGKLTLDPHPFSLDKLLRDMAVILSANVGAKNVEVLFQIDPALPDWVVGDALRLQQILLNLAGNAIKFTEHGEVVLSARLVAAAPSGDLAGELLHAGGLEQDLDARLSIAFAIRDTGIGITPEQCGRIFDGFSQAEASTTRHFGGTGLGLAISRRLVQLMGGVLRVDSLPGQGSTFHFVVGCRAADAQQQAETATTALLRHLHCLVVDDNPTARLVLAEMAASLGWKADVVESGADALVAVAQRSTERPYDVIFIDWRMPALDGWETSKKIRQLLCAEKMPLIVMVTAFDRALLAEKETLASVLDAVLEKPITASMMFDAVADARLGQHWKARPLAAPTQRRLAGLRLLVVEDSAINQQVARELLSNDGALVDVADCGQAAIEATRLAGTPFDLILMDIQMPDMDGYAATRAIRARLGPAAPPVIAMTANAMPADREAALAAGMVDHVGKPFDLTQLIAVILRHARRAGPSAAVVGGTKTGPADRAVLNSAAALSRLGGNKRIYLLALRGFIVEAGELGAQLHTALAERRREAAAALLHSLTGSAGTVGADQLARLAGQTERALSGAPEAAVCWDGLAALVAALPQAVNAAERLAAELDADAAAPVTAPSEVDRSGLRAGLDRLSALLANGNVDACSLFESLEQRYRAGMPAGFFRLQLAMEKMDFKDAAQLCADMLLQLENGQH